MELIDAIRERRSIRKFLSDPVDEKDIIEIVEAGTLAPNAENHQMCKFVAVTNTDLVEKIGKVVSNRVNPIIIACKDVEYENINHHKYFLTFF
ncbi:nitroreductase family protein [Serpentinicella alkaliphila]|uniref:Nitroreductase family protein n=1 Tax=Serpentinicella alkaliphila TaxID=1734049 RepID=A0A4V2T406_9FIRM|nr:nitroreductase family protein [Serpentinicella alkaliphila]QUH24855.1 nitroreductase family protein [Serpentinicella alkaliphila]TCQ03434.1 nitroreductase family protein [Serpentinicella alkaliphila]